MIAALLSQIAPYAVLVAGGLIAFITAYIRGKKAGEKSAKAQQQADEIKANKSAKEITNEIANLSDADLDKRLNGWLRDNNKR